MHSSISLCQGK